MPSPQTMFTEEQIQHLSASPHVEYASRTTVRLTDACKETLRDRMQSGEDLPDILRSLGIDQDVLGPNRLNRYRRSFMRGSTQETWPELQGDNVSSTKLTKKQMKAVQHKIERLEAEVMFLRKLVELKEASMGVQDNPKD